MTDEVDEAGRGASFRMDPVAVGLAASIFLVDLTGWPVYSVLLQSAGSGTLTLVRVVQSVLFGVSLLCVAALHRRSAGPKVGMLVAAATCLALGMASLFAGAFLPGGAPLVWTALVLLPFGRASLMGFWVASLAEAKGRSSGRVLALAWLAATAADIAVRVAPGVPAQLVATGAAAALAFGVPFFCRRSSGHGSGEAFPSREDPSPRGDGMVGLVRESAPLMAFMGTTAFFSAFIHVLLIPGSSYGTVDPGLVRSLCFAAFLVWLLPRCRVGVGLSFLGSAFQGLCMAVMTAGFALALVGSAASIFASLLTAVVTSASTVLLALACVEEARRRGIATATVYCVFVGAYDLFLGLGNAAGFGVGAMVSGDGAHAVDVAASVCIYALALLMFFLNRSYQRAAERRAAAEQAVQSEGEPDRLASRCAEVADAAGLTPREAEVFAYVAQGRDAAYVCAKLSISENTVRTHIKSIYRKLDIHGRQELFALVNGD